MCTRSVPDVVKAKKMELLPLSAEDAGNIKPSKGNCQAGQHTRRLAAGTAHAYRRGALILQQTV